MHHAEWKMEGSKLIVTVDISKQSMDEAPPSASGKTFLVASIGSAIPVPREDAKSLTAALNRRAKKSISTPHAGREQQ